MSTAQGKYENTLTDYIANECARTNHLKGKWDRLFLNTKGVAAVPVLSGLLVYECMSIEESLLTGNSERGP